MKKLMLAAALVMCAATMRAATNEAEVLMNADKQFAKESLAEGGKAWSRWFAENAVKPGAEGKWVIGSKAIGEQMEKALADPKMLEWEPEHSEVSKGGTLGYTWGRWTRHLKDKEGKPVNITGTYMTVWEKQKDGSWKIVFDTGDAD